MFLAQPQRIRRTGFHQSDRLIGLQRRTRKGDKGRITQRQHLTTITIHHYGDAVMNAFHCRAAMDFRQLHKGALHFHCLVTATRNSKPVQHNLADHAAALDQGMRLL